MSYDIPEPHMSSLPQLEALLLPPSTTCCAQLYRQPLSSKLLRKVIRVELQEADGDCHLQAFVLHLARRSVCIHPQNRSLARWFERQGKRFPGKSQNNKARLDNEKKKILQLA
uniref:Chemokine interleukin-8-like domain-containing protein n=1 Tax=Marmota marmota marmota TaxID=9994 RepID=A0A8C5ZYC6_MARMA